VTKGRELAVAVLLLAVGGVLAWVCVGRTWLRPSDHGGSIALTGRDLGLSAVLGLATVAAGAAVLATRRYVRIAVGVVAVALSAGVIAQAVHVVATKQTRVLHAHGVGSTFAVPSGGFPRIGVAFPAWLTVVAGVIALIGALMVVVRSRTWPALGQRYEAPGGESKPEPVAAQAIGDRGVWDALDRGEDPT
jgi:uncharacterized membrane protein (TIGR02234 family)